MINLKSPAKLNLFLNIVNKRTDGYHDIETYFQLINLYDEISLEIIPGKNIKFLSDKCELNNGKNLCVQAAEILRRYVNKESDLNSSIVLKKNIPIGWAGRDRTYACRDQNPMP